MSSTSNRPSSATTFCPKKSSAPASALEDATTPEYELALLSLVVDRDAQMLTLQLCKILYAVEHIGIKAHLVFKTLRRCVRQPCECAEIGGVYEKLIAESADVNAVLPAGNDLLRSFHRVAAYAVELGKIVGASRRHIAMGISNPAAIMPDIVSFIVPSPPEQQIMS